MFKEMQDAQQGSMLEREFFHKKEREMIDKIKQNEAAKQDYLERTNHYKKCSHCGSNMHEMTRQDISFLHCDRCESLHIGLNELDHISLHKHQLREIVSELLIAADEKKKNHKKAG